MHAPSGDPLLGSAPGAEPRFGDELLNSCFGQVDPSFTLPTEIARAFPPATYFCFALYFLRLYAARADEVNSSNLGLAAGDDERAERLSLPHGSGDGLRQLGAHAQRFTLRDRIAEALRCDGRHALPVDAYAAVGLAFFGTA